MKRRQVEFSEGVLRNLDGVVVAAALGRAVSYKMLWAGRNAIRRVELLTLVAEHMSPCHRRVQVGVFTKAFRYSAPARVPRNVDHRRKRPADSACGRFPGGYAGRPLNNFRGPSGR